MTELFCRPWFLRHYHNAGPTPNPRYVGVLAAADNLRQLPDWQWVQVAHQPRPGAPWPAGVAEQSSAAPPQHPGVSTALPVSPTSNTGPCHPTAQPEAQDSRATPHIPVPSREAAPAPEGPAILGEKTRANACSRLLPAACCFVCGSPATRVHFFNRQHLPLGELEALYRAHSNSSNPR